jgi:two-component system chemotaxis response regulator CheY
MNREEVQILIIDDVNTMRTLTRSVLIKLGFRNITSVEGAEEAKEALSQKKYDLLLCDWYMTPTDGISFLKFIRGNPDLTSILFIMITAETTAEKVTEAIVTGVDDYLIKPYSQDQIEGKVCGLLIKKKVIAS